MPKPMHTIIAFPTIVAAFGGAQSVRYSARSAWVTMPRGEVIRVPRSTLGPVESWTGFKLADVAVRVQFAARGVRK